LPLAGSNPLDATRSNAPHLSRPSRRPLPSEFLCVAVLFFPQFLLASLTRDRRSGASSAASALRRVDANDQVPSIEAGERAHYHPAVRRGVARIPEITPVAVALHRH
jgi:hypothetical protein